MREDPNLQVQLARQVTHPSICRIFDLFQHQPPGGCPDVVCARGFGLYVRRAAAR